MNIRNSSKYILGGLAAAGLLAGCSGGSQAGLAPSVMTPTHTHSSHATTMRPYSVPIPTVALHAQQLGVQPKQRNGAKVSPSYTATGPLLFLSDFTGNDVQVYKYSSGSVGGQVATIVGFNGPQGECEGKSKAAGTVGKSIVWITNTGNEQIEGFVRGQTAPSYVVNTFDPDPGYFPVGCSLDPKTGNLAVTNIEDVGGGVGNVAIFTPTDQAISNAPPSHTYFAPGIWRYYFAGYDGNGNLFVDGLDNSLTTFVFDELPNGVGPGTQLNYCGPGCAPLTINFPGGVEYDSETKYMAVVDQNSGAGNSKQYEFQISGGTATQKKNTPFDIGLPYGPGTDIVQQWLDIKTDRVFTPDAANAINTLYQHSNGGGCGFPCYPTVIIAPGNPPFSTPTGSALLR
jgi:hypothetical protein